MTPELVRAIALPAGTVVEGVIEDGPVGEATQVVDTTTYPSLVALRLMPKPTTDAFAVEV